VPASHCVCTLAPSRTFHEDLLTQEASVGWHSGLHSCVLGTVMYPGSEGTQAVDPGCMERCPLAQGVQVWLPLSLNVPAGQGRHCDEDEAPAWKP
jgi:hypothetical protein